MKVHNILIVDDDEMITSTLSRVVSIMLGQNVLTFNDPTRALEAVSMEKPDIDLVISDFIMPEMNGIEFLKRLRLILPDAVFILLTGYSDKENAIASINEIGIYHYMEKPWDNEVLVHTIQNGLDKKRLKDELKEKILELESRNLEIKDLYSRLEEEYKKETERNITLEAAVAERTDSIRNLLDNAGQGFLSFGDDLLIDPDFSMECRKIFGKHIRGEDFSCLLYPDDETQRSLIRKLVAKILNAKGNDERELYMPLLPDSAAIGGFSVAIEYKAIKENSFSDQKKLMVILTDTTEKHELENRIEREKNIFKMVVKVVTSVQDFSTCLEEFREFLNKGADEIIMTHETQEEALNEIFRRVHTMKGNFSMYNMQKTVDCLHQAEDKIIMLQNMQKNIDREQLLFLVGAIDFKSGFDGDQAEITKILGNDYFMPDNLIRVNRAALAELETRMAAVLDPKEFMALAPSVRRLGYRKAGDLLSSYLDYAIVLSERNGKMLAPVRLNGGDTRIDQDLYSGFIRTLIHVFRNSVIHGIESPEERSAKGKDINGAITCEIKQDNHFLEFTISDDGRGIDLQAVREKAVHDGLYSAEQAARLGDDELVMLIFKESFSTAGDVSQQSGRGIGLSAVLKELQRVDGSVSVETRKDRGTRFHFRIPVKNEDTLSILDARDIAAPSAETAAKVIGSCVGDGSPRIEDAGRIGANVLNLFENTVLIGIEGQMEGFFFMTYDKDLTGSILAKSVPELPDDKRTDYTNETLSEMTNIVLGNCMGEFRQFGDYIMIGTPHAINAAGLSVAVASSAVRQYKIHFKTGVCCVGVINAW